ncbi:uncharacterized protein QYS62_001705 [Fusarium acuminatum]|uniref:DUF7580 domain-containing protein n=1 Tax=Fusarium acuminatum TaxID=5515 RepID=A0ABZ2WJB9_9HYPO
MFLSTQQDWHEVIVHTTSGRQVKVVFDESHNPSPEVKCAPVVKTMKVKNLCEQITKIKSRALYRLVFKVTRSQLFKLQSERSGSVIQKSQNSISPEKFLRNKSDSFTEKTKRILAVILSSAVFHLHNTPWLESAWNSPGRTSSKVVRATFTSHNTSDEFRDGRAQQGSPPNKRWYSRSPIRTEAESLVSNLPTLLDAQVYPRSSYTVGILCALSLELLAVQALLDIKHQSPKYTRGDSNTYALGKMSDHMVVVACLPSGEYGTNAAADSASNMKRTFPNIKFCLLVGIGGGAPTHESDIRLGGVVVSLPITKYPGVIQYDRGKEIQGNTFELTGSLHPPPRCLMTAISSLRSNPDLPSNALQSSLEEVTRRVPEPLASKYQHPGQDQDWLRKAVCAVCQRQGECPNRDSHLFKRPHRSTSQPEIHYGPIASGNRVLKDAGVLDRWAQEYGILCFEMEAAGVMNTFPCLVIRGICDYADSYKDKRWQHYAAATAAAYAKLLLGHTAANITNWDRSSEDEVIGIQYQNIQERSSKRQRF